MCSATTSDWCALRSLTGVDLRRAAAVRPLKRISITAPTPTPAPKPGILNIAPYVGGKSKIEGVSEPIKLSSNENPLGCSDAAREAYFAAVERLHIYPRKAAPRSCARRWRASSGWRRTG